MSKPLFLLLILIVLTGAIIRVGVALHQPETAEAIDRLPDQREYLSLAQNLLHEGSLNFFDARFSQVVFAYRMPGYPLFLAACGGSIRIARLAQCAIDLSTVIAVFLIARKLSGNARTGVIASLLMAVNPFYVFFSALLLSETLFAASVIWAIWFFISQQKWLAIVFLIAGVFLRPTGILLVPVLAMVGNPNAGKSAAYQLWDALRYGAIATFMLVGCLLPWAWRNNQLLGGYVWTTTNTGITIYDGFNPRATGASDQRFIAENLGFKSMNELERSRYFQAQAMDWMNTHRSELTGLSVKKIARGWSPVPLSAEFGKPIYRWISAGYSIPFDLLCLLGLFSRRLNGRAKLLLILPAVVVTIAQVMSVGSIRYRMPAEAPLAVLAAVGAVSVSSRWAKRTNKKFN